jgi:hypothetical protein
MSAFNYSRRNDDRGEEMNRALMVFGFALCVASEARTDDLNFSVEPGKRLKSEISSPGVPSIDTHTWMATCNRGIAITGYCASLSGQRQLQNVGALVPNQWSCTWTEPTSKAEVMAVCLYEE